MTSGYIVKVVVELRFELDDMPISEAYIAAGQQAQKLTSIQIDGNEVALQVRNLDVRPAGTQPMDGEINLIAVRHRMVELGLTSSRDVADRVTGVNVISHTTVNHILQGRQLYPSAHTRRKLALALDMPEDWLL